jgi:drug/metabolite transporter (DMT)-like permease
MIDTTLYQVTLLLLTILSGSKALSNMKIITTAVFAVIMMNKVLHRIQWCALILLAAGAVLAGYSYIHYLE